MCLKKEINNFRNQAGKKYSDTYSFGNSFTLTIKKRFLNESHQHCSVFRYNLVFF